MVWSGDYSMFSDESCISKHPFTLWGAISCGHGAVSLCEKKIARIRDCSRFPVDSLQWKDITSQAEAVEVLLRMPKIGEHVFTTNGKTPIGGFSTIKTAIDKATAEANLKPWRLHDLRRSTATGMAELGFAPHVVEMVLNHISGEKAGVSGLYNRSRYEADCRRALAAWAAAVMAITANNVVALRS